MYIKDSIEREISVNFVIDRHRAIYPYLVLGLASYALSHAGNLDEILYGRRVPAFASNFAGFELRYRTLACLSEFVGSPVWIFEPQGESNEYFLSIKIEEFTDLWGPLQSELVPTEWGVIECLHSSKGVIATPFDSALMSLTKSGEIACHWSPSLTLDRKYTLGTPGALDYPQNCSYHKKTRLLIGFSQQSRHSSIFADCQTDIRAKQQTLGTSLQNIVISAPEPIEKKEIPKASRFFKGNGRMMYKLYPRTTQKSRFLLHMKKTEPDWDNVVFPFLKQYVGLEISACTGNARRISLWDALKLFSMGRHYNGNPKLAKDSLSRCLHLPGDIQCVEQCWGASNLLRIRNESVEDQQMRFRSFLRSAITQLGFTGVNDDGNLLACWPYTENATALIIHPKSTDGSEHGWIPWVKDRVTVATFAVMSSNCFCFNAEDALSRTKVSRKCPDYPGPTPRQLSHTRVVDLSRSVLYTSIQMDPETKSTLEKTHTQAGEPEYVRKMARLAPGLRIRIMDLDQEVGTLEVRNSNEEPLTLFREPTLIEKMSEAYICTKTGDWGHRHRELMNKELNTEFTLPAFIY